MRKTIVLLTGVCLCACSVFAQMEIEWERNYGGSDWDGATSIQQTTDGGWIVAGYTESNDQDVGGNYGIRDYWIIKLDPSGNIDWEKNFGGSNWDTANSIEQTGDGGYIIVGKSRSNNQNVGGNYGEEDYWIVKLDASGEIDWERNYGGSAYDEATSIQQTADEGYIVAVYSTSDDQDVGGNFGSSDYWIIKLDPFGNLDWEKNFGGSATEHANSIQQTLDGGYIVAGYSESNDQNVGGNQGGSDYWIIKLDPSGNLDWEQNFGGSAYDVANTILQTEDEEFIVAGFSWSNDQNLGANFGLSDYWVIKLDLLGNLIWEQNFGGNLTDTPNAIQHTMDGGYILAGTSSSNDQQDVGGNFGFFDYWVLKLKPCPTYTTTIDTLLCPGEVAPLPDTLITYFGCDSIINYNIIELPLPGDGQEFTVCALEAQLQAPSLGDTITGVWTSDTPGIIFSDAQAPDAVVEGLQPGWNQFTWTVSHPECPDYSSAEVAVFYEDGLIEAEDDIYNYTPDVLQANVLDNDLFPNLTDIEATIVEDFGGSGDAGELELDPSGNFTFSLQEPTVVLSRQFRYRVAHTSCPEIFDEATVRINLNSNTGQEGEEESTSLVFTPNGDGINDRFIIPELEERPQDFPANSLVVINRWGDVVYRAQPYNNDWDGTHWRTGKALPQGTYFYIARLSVVEGIVREERVTLIR